MEEGAWNEMLEVREGSESARHYCMRSMRGGDGEGNAVTADGRSKRREGTGWFTAPENDEMTSPHEPEA